jgi:hypothetical protein
MLNIEPVHCNYGSIRVLQSVFTSSTQHFYTSRTCTCNAIYPNSNRDTGENNTLGEMEMM